MLIRKILHAARRIERERYDCQRNRVTIDVVVNLETLDQLVDEWVAGEFMLRLGVDGRYMLAVRTFDTIGGIDDVLIEDPEQR